MRSTTHPVRLAEWIRAACLLEATARKPGNVHPEASFADLCCDDFVKSADVVAPILANAAHSGVGRVVCDAVEATRLAVGSNTNLGICLLIAPLAAVPSDIPLSAGIDQVLERLTNEDARFVYRAIRRANPGGMGSVPEEDISDDPQGTLRDVMRLAAERDRVAAQYANGFRDVLQVALGLLESLRESFSDDWEAAVIRLHLELMARFPDTLIARKCGLAEAQKAANLAQGVLEADWPVSPIGQGGLIKLDNWLRTNDNRRNPGTTADLVTAGLFAAFREGVLQPPSKVEPPVRGTRR